MSDEVLKPCPFCGGAARKACGPAHPSVYRVRCTSCGACSERGGSIWVVSAWNRRAYVESVKIASRVIADAAPTTPEVPATPTTAADYGTPKTYWR